MCLIYHKFEKKQPLNKVSCTAMIVICYSCLFENIRYSKYKILYIIWKQKNVPKLVKRMVVKTFAKGVNFISLPLQDW